MPNSEGELSFREGELCFREGELSFRERELCFREGGLSFRKEDLSFREVGRISSPYETLTINKKMIADMYEVREADKDEILIEMKA